MTNSDLEEVGITDPEEKLSILDAIYEIKVLSKFLNHLLSIWKLPWLHTCYIMWTFLGQYQEPKYRN